jgi:hypothetical protein
LPVRGCIEELLARYCELIDDGDFAGLGVLFEHGVITVEDGTVVARGADEVRAFYERFTRRYPDGTPHSQHVVSNLIVEAAEQADRFVARSVFVVFQAIDDLALQPITFIDRGHGSRRNEAHGPRRVPPSVDRVRLTRAAPEAASLRWARALRSWWRMTARV